MNLRLSHIAWLALSALGWIGLVIWWLGLGGCAATLPVPIAPPVATVMPVDGSDCARAGARIEELHCFADSGEPLWRTPDGTPFADACKRAAEDGRDWHPAVLAVIRDCTELEAAYRGEAP